MYGLASKQQININKSEFLISPNIGAKEIDAIVAIWDVHSCEHHDQYFGIPSLVERSKCNTFKEL